LVEIVDVHMTEPVRRRRSLHRLAEAAVALAAGRDHRVIGLSGLEHLRAPAEELRVEVLRLLGLGRDLFVPDELADRGCDCAHLFDLLVVSASKMTSSKLVSPFYSIGSTIVR